LGHKRSKFFISNFNDDDGNAYYYHTSTGSMLKVSQGQLASLEEMISNPEAASPLVLERLIETGFVIKNDVDEVQQVQQMALHRNYNKSDHLELTILPTEQCNFRCVYCYEDFKLPVMSEEHQESLIKYVRKEMAHRKGLSVGWFGGEPLMALPVIEKLSTAFIEICELNKKPYNATVTTNAYTLDVSNFERLRNYRVNHFQITIDGPRQTHDKQRVLMNGSPTFDKILNNLCEIRDKAKGRIWTIAIRTNVTKPMLKHMDEYTDMINKNFGNDKRFMIQIRQMWTNNTEEADDIVIDEESFGRFIDTCSLAGFSLSQDYKFTHNLNYICYAGKPHSFVIRSNGDVHKCTAQIHVEGRQIGKLEMDGNLNINMSHIAKWCVPTIDKLNHCKNCGFFGACAGIGCPIREVNECEAVINYIRPYLHAFYKIAPKAYEMTEYLQRR